MEPIRHWNDEFSDYLDGELGAAEREALEAHLVTCRECAETLSDLRRVVARAAELPNRPPESDLWPAIERRLGPRRSWFRLVRSGSSGGPRRFSLSVPQMAAVAATLVVVSAAAMWLALGGPIRRPAPAGPPTASAPPTIGASANFDEARYDATVAELERVLNQHRSELDPATVHTIEQNLAIIDRATSQARRALLADPNNPYLHGHLAEQMKRKIWLLQRAAEVVTAQS